MCLIVKYVFVLLYFLLICKKKFGLGDWVLIYFVLWLYVVVVIYFLLVLVLYVINIVIIDIYFFKNFY